MITRPEAKTIADSVISPERREELLSLFDATIQAAAAMGAYQVNVSGIVKMMNESNDAELIFTRDFLRAAPQNFTTSDFGTDGIDHWVSWE